MRQIPSKFGLNVSGLFTILAFILVFTSQLNAQECKRLLEDVNRRPIFPTGKVDEYISCLSSIDNEHKRLLNIEPKNKAMIADIKGNLLAKNRSELSQARAANDSARIDKLIKKENELKTKLDSLTNDITISNTQSNTLKNLLKDSYVKIIAFFVEIQDSRKNEYQRKLDLLNREN